MSKFEEIQALYNIPAPFVDKFYLTPLGHVVRLTFVETTQETETVNPRAAVTITADSLVFLHSLLGQVVDLINKQKEETKPTKESEKDEVLH